MDTKHLAINWTDGVKITQEHFHQSNAHMTDSIRELATMLLTDHNYGLIYPIEGEKDAFSYTTVVHTQERLSIKLDHCNAITQGGHHIYYDPKLYGDFQPVASIEAKNLDSNTTITFLLLLTIEPFEHVPVGRPDPENIPLHHPYVMPKITMHLVSQSQFNASFLQTHHLILGKVEWKNMCFVLDKDYIPPTSKIKYHPALSLFQKRATTVLVNLRSYCLIINRKNQNQFTNNKLSNNTFKLCLKVMDFVGEFIFQYSQIAKEQSPIFIPQSISVLGNYFSNELAMIPETEKEELLQYFYEWVDIKPSELEQVIGGIIDVQYVHTEISSMLKNMDYFMAIIERLWKKLSDLEYIGQRKDNIVVSEDKFTLRDNQQQNSWSIID
ncbi:hypothetical protein [Flagellimonas marinaquae]|uniref:hypothetical protein n=1 Tax=Flagellimonas marinaquae TaxID=254955 RepID=UPI0020762CB0|nr:hypothetical protein [Allomuricauda aquimarina]USD26869.1 hypothetical protein MJO53_08220 [Allomuricauda aquimarina]